MKNEVKFKWEGGTEYETGVAIYEIGTSAHSLCLPNLRSANIVHMVLLNAYRKGYESGVYNTKAEVQSALSKLMQ
jgi:hypothetical protein